jgi:phytoene dehydrogenase-like protein
VIGAGPNGLAAAICLARPGCVVTLFEAEESVGGGMRSAELTLPGFLHDVCSTIHPLAVASPFLATLPLRHHGLAFIEPPIALAHPLDGGDAVLLHRSLDATAAGLGDDCNAYRLLMVPLVRRWPMIDDALLGPLCWPRHPVARFGLVGLRLARAVAEARFSGPRARALLAGLGAIRCFGSTRRRVPPSPSSSPPWLIGWGGQSPGEARSGSPRRSRPISAPSAVGSSPAVASRVSTSSRPRG